MPILWIRKVLALSSLDDSVIRLPISFMKLRPSVPHEPLDSIAMGMKWYCCARLLYFLLFSASFRLAIFPAWIEEKGRLEGADVSEQVKSQINGLPLFQGNRVISSGLLPSVLLHPIGSRTAGMPAEISALIVMSLTFE